MIRSVNRVCLRKWFMQKKNLESKEVSIFTVPNKECTNVHAFKLKVLNCNLVLVVLCWISNSLLVLGGLRCHIVRTLAHIFLRQQMSFKKMKQ